LARTQSRTGAAKLKPISFSISPKMSICVAAKDRRFRATRGDLIALIGKVEQRRRAEGRTTGNMGKTPGKRAIPRIHILKKKPAHPQNRVVCRSISATLALSIKNTES
jgi:hypothetical protein